MPRFFFRLGGGGIILKAVSALSPNEIICMMTSWLRETKSC